MLFLHRSTDLKHTKTQIFKNLTEQFEILEDLANMCLMIGWVTGKEIVAEVNQYLIKTLGMTHEIVIAEWYPWIFGKTCLENIGFKLGDLS